MKGRGALRELSQVEWRVFVALSTTERPASARAVGTTLERMGFKIDPNAVRVYLSKCVAKGYARAVDPPGTPATERERGRPPQLYYEPAKNLRPAIQRQFRRWLADWAIPDMAEDWLIETLRPTPERNRRRQQG